MSDVFKNWLKQNRRENEETLKTLRQNINASASEPKNITASFENPVPSTSQQASNASAGAQILQGKDNVTSNNEQRAQSATKPTDLSFENDSLKLSVVRGAHKQQTKSNFRFSDHMWYLSVVPKGKPKKMPLLVEILNFLFVAFNFILKELKNFYKPSDRNIAFITITQAEMLNGLNSGQN